MKKIKKAILTTLLASVVAAPMVTYVTATPEEVKAETSALKSANYNNPSWIRFENTVKGSVTTNRCSYYMFRTDYSKNIYFLELKNEASSPHAIWYDVIDRETGKGSGYNTLPSAFRGDVARCKYTLDPGREYILMIKGGLFTGTYNFSFKMTHSGNSMYLAKTTSGKWVNFSKGRTDYTYSGLSKSSNGKWYYVKKGIFNTSFTGLAKAPNGKWYHVTKGKYNASYTGLSRTTSGKWYYVRKGKFDPKFSGKVKYNGKIYNVKNGKLI